MGRRAIVLASIVVAVFAACDGEQRYVYSAQRFDPVAGCLDVYKPVETVPGEGVSINCRVTCLTVGADTYLSTLCPPVPDIATETDAQTPECQAALDASRLEAGCGSDEGEDTGDGGEDTDGATDDDGGGDDGAADDGAAGEDAGADVRADG